MFNKTGGKLKSTQLHSLLLQNLLNHTLYLYLNLNEFRWYVVRLQK